MTNDEIRMTKKHRPTEAAAIRHQSFELRHSFVIRAYSFVILPMHPTFHRLIFWGHLIVGIVAGLVILAIRRRTLGGNDGASPASLMEEMRRLRDSGQMTPEEFEATKRKLVERARAQTPDLAARRSPER